MTGGRGILAAALALAFLLGGGAAAAMFAVAGLDRERVAGVPQWHVTAWPIPLDQWGRGRAFRCAVADCGAEIIVLIRAKAGFCNCQTGIVDDEELDRVSDADLFGHDLVPRAAGRAIMAGSLAGRSRVYRGTVPGQGILATAFHSGCDAIVATGVTAANRLGRIEPAMRALIEREIVPRRTLAAARR